MGNRAVIVQKDTNKTNAQNRLGIYLHWCGSENTVKEFLAKAKEREIHNPNGDSEYGWARLCQVIGDELSADGCNNTTLGIGIVAHLDTHNWDNGVYYIDENWDIVKHTDGAEFDVDYSAFKRLAQMYEVHATGSFHTALFDAIKYADDKNLERLKIAFPEYVFGFQDRNEPEVSDSDNNSDYIPNID